jgi:hypothetical protein
MNTEMDSFIKYLYTVEESCETLTADQFQKLCLIQTKVTELVDKVNTVFSQSTQSIEEPQIIQQLEPISVHEKKVIGFQEFITEKVEKKGLSSN